MKAAVLHQLGVPPRFEDFAEPVAGENEIVLNVRASSLKAVDRQLAAGTHFASPREFPVICGTDGVGTDPKGARVFFGGSRRPFGTMAERTIAPAGFCFPVPESLDDASAAALPNPGVSAFLSLAHSAKLARGENILILGATGVTGTLAVQIAKLLGAGRVIAAGRNRESLEKLKGLGADAILNLNQPDEDLKNAFAREAGETGFQVVIDYVWGKPAELLFSALTRSEFAVAKTETRFVQVGESAGAAISLPAAVLRSTALTISGTAGIPPIELLVSGMKQVFEWAARGTLRIETESVPLREVESAWQRTGSSARRLVFIL